MTLKVRTKEEWNDIIEKARQQGIEIGIDKIQCDECRTTPHEIIGSPTILCKKHYEERCLKWVEQGKKAEKERIILFFDTEFSRREKIQELPFISTVDWTIIREQLRKGD